MGNENMLKDDDLQDKLEKLIIQNLLLSNTLESEADMYKLIKEQAVLNRFDELFPRND